MNCSTAREHILQTADDDALLAHFAECEACRELAEANGRLAQALGPPDEPPPPDPRGFEKVQQITSEQDGDAVWRLRGMPTRRRTIIGVGSTLVAAIICIAAVRRADWDVYPMMRMGVVLASMFFGAVFAVVLSMRGAHRPEYSLPKRLAAFVVLVALPFIPALFGAAHHAHPASVAPVSLLASAGACLGFGTLAALPALLVIRILQRSREAELWPTLFGALAAALAANIALQTHCAIVAPSHIVVGHAMLGLVYAALAWIVVRLSAR